MLTRIFAVCIGAVALALAGCGGRSASTVALPNLGPDITIEANMPKDSIGEKLGSQGLYTVNSAAWKATLSGFTQVMRSQALGFPPGTKLTIHNLSTTTTHTLDVVKVITKAPADFPSGVKLSIPAKGSGKLETGYASGPIKPGGSVTVTLVKAGVYLIGCAYHYKDGMRDVLVVATHATPGPQATPTPVGGGSGSGSGSGW
jgi:plastocyanin